MNSLMKALGDWEDDSEIEKPSPENVGQEGYGPQGFTHEPVFEDKPVATSFKKVEWLDESVACLKIDGAVKPETYGQEIINNSLVEGFEKGFDLGKLPSLSFSHKPEFLKFDEMKPDRKVQWEPVYREPNIDRPLQKQATDIVFGERTVEISFTATLTPDYNRILLAHMEDLRDKVQARIDEIKKEIARLEGRE